MRLKSTAVIVHSPKFTPTSCSYAAPSGHGLCDAYRVLRSLAPSAGPAIETVGVVSRSDGNMINLQIIPPAGDGPFAGVCYFHGGGMMMASCYDVVECESGGANLVIATAMKLKQDGDLRIIPKGICVQWRYLARVWEDRPGSSVVRKAGLPMDARELFIRIAYGVEELTRRNPLA